MSKKLTFQNCIDFAATKNGRCLSIEYAIYIPSLKLAIEYDGWYFHHSDRAIKNRVPERDKRKDNICANKNIKLLRLNGNIQGREWQKERLEINQKVTKFVSDNKEL